MKKNVNLLLLLLIFATPAAFAATEKAAKNVDAPAAVAKQSYKPKSPKLDRAQFDALLAKPEQLLVIDLRQPDEITNKGGFPVYLSIQADQLEKSLAYIPKDRLIVTVSNHSTRSGKSADLLTSKGFNVAGYVGAEYYAEEGGKLIKIAPRPPKISTK